MLRLSPLIAALALVGTSVHAMDLAIVNPGFENTTGQTVNNEFTFGTPFGWDLYDPMNIISDPSVYTGTLEPNGVEFFPVTAPEGDKVAILFNSGQKGNGEYGYVQTLSESLQPNMLYTLTVQVGNITSGTAESSQFFDLSNFPGYRVDLLADGVAINSDLGTLSIAEGAWGLSTVSFTTGETVLPDQELGIRLVNLNATTAAPDNEVDFDDVNLTATSVPEPAVSILVLAIGLVLLLGRGRMRNRVSQG